MNQSPLIHVLIADDPTQLLTTFASHTGWIWSVAFSSDGNTLASSGSDSSVRLWNV